MEQKIKSNSSFGNNLRIIRKTHGYTQEEIVAKLQLKNQDISLSATNSEIRILYVPHSI